jgi:hypothetical protein
MRERQILCQSIHACCQAPRRLLGKILAQRAYTSWLPRSPFRSSAVLSITSDEQRVVAKSWPGGEKRRSGRASHLEACAAREAFLHPCVAIGVSLRAVWGLSGATPRGQPWTSAVTLPQGRNGLSARRRAVLSPCHELSLCHHVHHACMRRAGLNVIPLIAATACHQSNDVERYSRCSARCGT